MSPIHFKLPKPLQTIKFCSENDAKKHKMQNKGKKRKR